MRKIIDLTMPVYEGMPNHPAHGRTPLFLPGTRNHEAWKLFNVKNPYNENDLVSFENEQIILCSHTGTHMDSCFHADPKGETIDFMPIDRGYGDAIWLDLSHKYEPKGEITAEDLEEAEQKSGSKVKKGDILLIHTGSSKTIDDDYINKHMGLTIDAGFWIREKGVKTLGIDTPSPDTNGCGMTLPIHMNFLRPTSLGLPKHDYIAIIENVININAIPKPRFTFVGTSLLLKGATGSPIRAFAIVD